MAGLLRNSLTKMVPVIKTNLTQRATVVSGPPKNPMSVASKLTQGTVMCAVILTPMLWIMANVKHYRGTADS